MYLIGKDRAQQIGRIGRDILVSPDLEMELSGINERGVRPPIVRIPVKTHLSSVILSNNPWEERELEKKLEQIRQERRRRENTLNWFQRQFFVNQVFDQDDKLRFAGDAAEDIITARKSNENRSTPPSGKSRRLSIAKTPKHTNTHNISDIQQKRSERLHEARNGTETFPLRQPSVISEADSDLDSIATLSPAPRRQKGGVKLPVIKMQALGIFSSASQRKRSSRSARMNTLPNLKSKHVSDLTDNFKLENSYDTQNNVNDENVSIHSYDDVTEEENLFLTDRQSACPDDDHRRCFGNVRNTQPANSRFNSKLKSGRYHIDSDRRQSMGLPCVEREDFESPRDNIDGIVMRLTQALPPKLMANAHENANRLLYGRRKIMTESARRESNKNTMEDPRWRKLVDSLVNIT